MLSDVIVKPQQLLIRPGINYEINKHIEIGGGYAYVPTYRYGTYPIRTSFTEHRLFQNLILRHKLGRLSLMHRFRFDIASAISSRVRCPSKVPGILRLTTRSSFR